MIDTITTIGSAIFAETGALFIEMAPYLLLGLTVAGVLSVVMKKSFVARQIGSPGIGSVIKASLLGVPLPLCSCGVVPTAAYLKRAGASRPAVMSFLISTPQTGVDSIVATYGMLGPLFAIFRPIAALFTGIIGGVASTLFGDSAEERANRDEDEATKKRVTPEERPRSLSEKVRDFFDYAFVEAVDDIAIHFLFGLIIGGVIAVVLPADFFVGRTFGTGLPAMLLMVVIGIPMYVCSTSSIPIAVALIAKGLSPGAAYVFLVAGPATNAATLAVLSRVLGKRQTALYVAVLIAGSLVFGPTMEWITSVAGWSPDVVSASAAHADAATWLGYGSALVLAALIVASFYRRWRPAAAMNARESAMDAGRDGRDGNASTAEPDGSEGDSLGIVLMNVEGMTCRHCAANVEDAVRSAVDTTDIEVDLSRHSVRISGAAEVDRKRVAEAIREAGYEPVE